MTKAAMGSVTSWPAGAEQDQLHQFIADSQSLLVISGAGCSTASGIPDYRDRSGQWKHPQPMQHRRFVDSEQARQRYWSRSLVGWDRFSRAQPNAAHLALAELERHGKLAGVITQNVDGLHQQAGSRNVIDLHGRLGEVVCLDCGELTARSVLQRRLKLLNPDWRNASLSETGSRPDGDVELGDDDHQFAVPDCGRCGGVVKPHVVFFGDGVPRHRYQRAHDWLEQADAVLVVGSSLMVYSAYRLVVMANQSGIPVAALNQGRTRADELLAGKWELACGPALSAAIHN